MKLSWFIAAAIGLFSLQGCSGADPSQSPSALSAHQDALEHFKRATFQEDYAVRGDMGGLLATMRWISAQGDRSEATVRWYRADSSSVNFSWTINGADSVICMENSQGKSTADGKGCVTHKRPDDWTTFLGLDDLSTLNTDISYAEAREIAGRSGQCFDLLAHLDSGDASWSECYADDGALLYASGLGARLYFLLFQQRLAEAGVDGSELDPASVEIIEATDVGDP